MIVVAALLVLLGLGLFVAGILTGTTAFYWGCVGVCAVAAVLLVLVRRQMRAEEWAEPAAAAPAPPPAERVRRPAEAARPPADGVGPSAAEDPTDPPAEEVEVTDLLLVVDLKDEVLVIDEHPRYHLAGCVHLTGREAIPLPLDEARADGFTPCARCAPDRHLADRARARRTSGGA